MTEKFHYDDNLFYLSLMVKNVYISIKLKIDVNLFSERILDDILFIDASIQKIYGSLKENSHLIKRNDYMHSLLRLKRNFSGVLQLYLKMDPEEYPEIQTYMPQLRRAQDMQEKDIIEIRGILRNSDGGAPQEDAISNDELNYLMTPVITGEDEE